MGSRDLPFAVKKATFSLGAYAHVTAGRTASADMNTGFFVCRRASAWKYIIKPQSPVIPLTPSASSSCTFSTKRASTSAGMAPAWQISNVSPGTTR